METLYRIFPGGALHGGTAIWRCYSGNRFSEDVDAYVDKDIEKIDRFFEELKKAGFKNSQEKGDEEFHLFRAELR